MRTHTTQLKTGITRTKEFEKKKLAAYAVNIGTKCGHDCAYCSTGAMLRMHKSFKEADENPFGRGYAIVDPDTPERVACDAQRIRERGLVQICTVVDAWSPEAKQYELGRRCLKAILSQSGWTVRVLTKNVCIREDFDLIEKYRDRILVGLSITATPDKSDIISVIEPNASSIQERMLAMTEAAARGLRTYAMLCPLLPGIADSPEQIEKMIQFAIECGVEEIYVEPVNARGPGLKITQEELVSNVYAQEAAIISKIRKRHAWSEYATRLIRNVPELMRIK